jgi:alpha-glucosidase (family GH31 glycosyl hydrolase)
VGGVVPQASRVRFGFAASFIALIGAAAVPLPSHASVSISSDRVVVSTEDARATITRKPFRVTFADGDGRTVLSEVANTAQGSVLVPPLPDPLPAGFRDYDVPTLYAPLHFLVGATRDLQFPAGPWVGNELLGGGGGVMYSARDVVAVERSGQGARLTVATSDPQGRTLSVTVTPSHDAAIRVSVTPSSADGVAAIGDSFASTATEAFHGFGGRHNGVDERGQTFYNWIEQENSSAGPLQAVPDTLPGTQGERYMFPNGPTAGYHVQSQFISSRRYGFLVDRDELTQWRMAADRDDAWQVSAAAPSLVYYVAPGAPAKAIRTTTALGGRQRVPPEWSLGPTYDRAVAFSGEGNATYKTRVDDDLKQLATRHLPISAYRIEGWNYYSDAELNAAIARVHALGARALVYFRAFVDTSGDSGVDAADALGEVLSGGYYATTPLGTPYFFGTNFNAPGLIIDFTNPATLKWWDGRITRALDLGADGFMQDFGEQTMADMRFHDGSTGAQMHNRYPVLYHRATRRIVDDWERRHPGREIFFFTRAGYSGTPGSAAYESANFPGDETTDWTVSSGLASQTSDMLNRAVGGAYGFTTDIGGYFDFITPAPDKELFLRWAEWAALSPFFRVHGGASKGVHTPWSYDAETVSLFERYARLHQRAVPLIRRLWRDAVRTGMPPTRPLWLAYPEDREAAKQDQEWLLGPDLLVAPVVTQGATARDVYFPSGCWETPDGGDRYDGAGHRTVSAPLSRLPYFVRCGTDPFTEVAAAGVTVRLRTATQCSGGALRVRVRGAGLKQVRRVDFYAASRHVGRDRKRPFAKTIARRRFGGAPFWHVRTVSRLKSGRKVTKRATVRRCRS